MHVASFPVYYLGHLAAVLDQYHIDLYRLLMAQGYTQEQLKNPQSAISTDAFARIVEALVSRDALRYLGIAVGKRLHITHHGALGLAILNAPTLRSIIQVVAQFLDTRLPFIELSVLETDDNITVVAHDLKWQRDVHRFIMEAVAMAFVNLQAALNERGNRIVIKQVMFDFAEHTHRHRYELAWPFAAAFEQPFSGFIIDNATADIPLVDSDALSFEQAIQQCKQEKQALACNTSIANRVEHFFNRRHCLHEISRSEYRALPTLKEVASQLAISERSLHRALDKEGKCFSGLLEQWLARQAQEMLLVRHLSVQVTAERLGYGEASNFRRAFKRWFGCSPSQYIKANNKQAVGTTH